MTSQVVCCLQEVILDDDLLRLIAMLKRHIRMALNAGCMQTPCGEQRFVYIQISSYQGRTQV